MLDSSISSKFRIDPLLLQPEIIHTTYLWGLHVISLYSFGYLLPLNGLRTPKYGQGSSSGNFPCLLIPSNASVKIWSFMNGCLSSLFEWRFSRISTEKYWTKTVERKPWAYACTLQDNDSRETAKIEITYELISLIYQICYLSHW